MGGGLMQLVAYGAQDIYLTGKPQITFFRLVTRRYTNFAMEAIEQTFNGQPTFGRKVTCTVSRNGDLAHRMYLEIDLNVAPNALAASMAGTVAVGGASAGTVDRFNADNGNDVQLAGAAAATITSNNVGNTAEWVQKRANRLNAARLGHLMIEKVEIEIGGQIIDTHYGEWMDMWSQLTHSEEQWKKLSTLINGSLAELDECATGANTQAKLYVPLQFWFNCNPGLALPLIALQYHEVKLHVYFASKACLSRVGDFSSIDLDQVLLYVDYIYLDTDERRRFAAQSHEYLIEQLQQNGPTSVAATNQHANINLNFNHPVKELVWRVQNVADEDTFNYWPTPFNQNVAVGANDLTERAHNEFLERAKLQLNGTDRFSAREGSYFRCVQAYQHHTGGHNQNPRKALGGFYTYSFALRPEEHQPSGTCNFSRLDSATLQLDFNDLTSSVLTGTTGLTPINQAKEVVVYARNYNVLRIMSGMGGLAYSN
jgi:hypothetical protein